MWDVIPGQAAFPRLRAVALWPALTAYRCGGSAGIANQEGLRTGFPFHPRDESPREHLKRGAHFTRAAVGRSRTAWAASLFSLVPTRCGGTWGWTLRVRRDAERHEGHSHAERGNDKGTAMEMLPTTVAAGGDGLGYEQAFLLLLP